MAIFRVKVIVLHVKILVHSKRGIWKVEPGFSNKDEGRVLILEDLHQIENITFETLYVPRQYFYWNTICWSIRATGA